MKVVFQTSAPAAVGTDGGGHWVLGYESKVLDGILEYEVEGGASA